MEVRLTTSTTHMSSAATFLSLFYSFIAFNICLMIKLIFVDDLINSFFLTVFEIH